EFDGMENLFEILLQRGALASIEDGIVGEVRWSVGLIGRDEANEFLLGHRLESLVEATLTPKRGDGLGGESFAAEGACAMRRVDQGFVGQRQKWVAPVMIFSCHSGSILSGPAPGGGF